MCVCVCVCVCVCAKKEGVMLEVDGVSVTTLCYLAGKLEIHAEANVTFFTQDKMEFSNQKVSHLAVNTEMCDCLH